MQRRGARQHGRMDGERGAGADIFVMPTRNEAFGLVFQEAAAAGVPAIGTRQNAVPEIIVDGETGLLVARAVTGCAVGRAANPDWTRRSAERLDAPRGRKSNGTHHPRHHRAAWWHSHAAAQGKAGHEQHGTT